MRTPIEWIRSKIWDYQFKRTPVTKLGTMLVKYFRGSYYCMGYEEEVKPDGKTN